MSAESRRNTLPLPSGRGWWIVAAGLVLGLAVFVMLWLAQRDNGDLYRPDQQPPAASGPAFKPLPAPPASGASSDEAIPAGPASGARLEEPWEPAAPGAPAAQAIPRDGPAAAAPPVELSASSPVPIRSPGPSYPARALRRGESGEVLLRIHVDARGVPDRVEVAASSGSRDLDRAAQRAVQRWRFRPAMRDGTPVAGVVTVPINFDSGG
ncbi:energy transducer TonB [Luteimonas terricola]|uniref:Energry transducer TonB n=1 Tax=Luteimonas terricola TaxID=645597 RepID=A0ABQ2EFV7_9GAMM|nr:energy transducer TonB [Luteimonas terricola]GGK06736.1 energry transducer TonB [Luteimonas terricola]